MGIVIDNPKIIQRIEWLSSTSGRSAEELVAEAIDAKFPHRGFAPLTGDRKAAAVQALQEAQEFFRTHRDPTDTRTPDEIIGYDQHGLPS